MNIKNIFIYVLSAAVVYFAFMLKIKQTRLEAMQTQNAFLEESIKRQYIIERNKVIYKYRTACGSSETKTYFVPVEGRAVITQAQDEREDIKVKNKGFTVKPFASAAYGNGATFALGARLAYFNRYGLGAAVNNKGAPLLSADRRLDDILPFENTSLIFLGGYKKAYLGIAIYL